jgi:hypothetical protein
LFALPIKRGAVHSEDVDELGLTRHEVDHMVQNQTLELPQNFLRRRIQRSTQFSTLQYVGFEVRDKYPNNIVRLRNGKVMVVTKITLDQEEDEEKPGKLTDAHYLGGFLFDKVGNCFQSLNILLDNNLVVALSFKVV